MVATTTEAIEQTATLIADLRDEVAQLVERLDRGWQIIDDRDYAGLDATDLEDHFKSLLAEYETACDKLRDLVD